MISLIMTFFSSSISKLFSNIWYIITAILVGVIIFLYIGLYIRDNKIEVLNDDLNKSKVLNSYYLMQFKALALSYNTSLQEFKTQKTQIELKYKDRIMEAKKIPMNKECDYTTKRIKEYAENNNSN